MRYRKKPVVIDAILLNHDSIYRVMEWMGTVGELSTIIAQDKFEEYKNIVALTGFPIKTLEGTMMASIGDYVIKGIQGEFYPCKPDIFEATYEKVED